MSEQNSAPEVTQRTVIQYLQSLQRAGIQQIGKIPAAVALAPAPQTDTNSQQPDDHTTPIPAPNVPPPAAQSAPQRPVAKQPVAKQPVANTNQRTNQRAGLSANSTPLPAAIPLDQRQTQLDILRDEVSNCTSCDELCSTRTQTVFGVGTIQPRLCFLGEAPGADEDRQGEPFVGAAGQLLNKIINACKMKREDVYILNTLKCRPPGNRNPLPAEASNCRGFFERQLELLNPEFICCLGSIAAQNLLETKESVGRLRGKFHDYRGIKVMVTYHPAYLLRTDSAKRYTWDDMKMLMQAMGVEV